MSTALIVGGSLDGTLWPGPSLPATFVCTATGEAYALSGSSYVRDAGNDTGPTIVYISPGATGPVALHCNTLPLAQVGVAYAEENTDAVIIKAVGGVAPYTFEVDDDDPLPDGLELVTSETEALISGTPEADTDGTYALLFRVTDANYQTGTLEMSLGVLVVEAEGTYGSTSSRQWTAQAASTAGGEIASAGVAAVAHNVAINVKVSQTVTAGTPVTAFKLFMDDGSSNVDTGLVIPSITGADSSSATLLGSPAASGTLSIHATVAGTLAAALVTGDISQATAS